MHLTRETVRKHTTSFKENLLKALADPKEAQAYLQAALAAYEADNNTDALLLAMRDVAQGTGRYRTTRQACRYYSGAPIQGTIESAQTSTRQPTQYSFRIRFPSAARVKNRLTSPLPSGRRCFQ